MILLRKEGATIIHHKHGIIGKRICLVDIDGDTFVGRVSDYFFPDDNLPDFTEEAIALYNPVKDGRIMYNDSVIFNSNEIKMVKIIT